MLERVVAERQIHRLRELEPGPDERTRHPLDVHSRCRELPRRGIRLGAVGPETPTRELVECAAVTVTGADVEHRRDRRIGVAHREVDLVGAVPLRELGAVGTEVLRWRLLRVVVALVTEPVERTRRRTRVLLEESALAINAPLAPRAIAEQRPHASDVLIRSAREADDSIPDVASA